jgi:uncharacterized protein YjbI with pentapeptide repeats
MPPHPLRIHRDLRGKDFSGANLAGTVFEGADLYRASFDDANLIGATFSNCFAAEASFKQSNCAHLRAIQTNLYRADLSGADLSDALLWNCVLAGADFRGATLRRLTVTLDCNSFEELRLARSASAELAYLFGRARTPHRKGWMDVVGERDLARLAHVFQR